MDVAEKEQRDGGNAVSIIWQSNLEVTVLGSGRMSSPTREDETMTINQLP